MMAPKDKTSIVIEVPTSNSSKIDELETFEIIKSFLIKKQFIASKDILNHKVISMPFAYPIVRSSDDLSEVYAYLSQIKNLNLSQNIILFQNMDTQLKNTLIKFADFLIMPSIQVGKSVEGFGISFLEAAKYGTASIGGIHGGASDIIKNKKTGLLCDGNSHEYIYKSLMLIMENNNYKVFGDNSKNYAKLFAWENQIKKYIDLIKKH